MTNHSPYRAPRRELHFVLQEWLALAQGLQSLSLPVCPDRGAIDRLIDELAEFSERTLAPLNRVGDEQGCTWQDGEVTTPEGFKAAYETFRRRGWAGLGAAQEHGGRAWPAVLTSLVTELVGSANHSWLMYHSISRGGYECIRANGTPDQRARYLPRLASGEWMGSMCITESEAGTDVGLIRTTASPGADGHYRLQGMKCMATVAEHDMADNIVHLVLARIEGAPAGSRGLSLFIVPKRLPDTAERNTVFCDGLEDKMGIRGTPTCLLRFQGAWGELLGEPGKGLAAMFVMMNIARLGTGMQGLNQAEVAYQMASRHARTRVQGRRPGASPSGTEPQPLIVHADVRRMLLTQKAWTQGARALAYWLAWQVDRAKAHPDKTDRAQADALLALLTPVFKAFATDNGLTSTLLAQQVMGGAGYMNASGLHQYVRDVRVGQIYEGANGIQGQDLLGRKVLGDGGASLKALLAWVEQSVAAHLQHVASPALSAWAEAVLALGRRLGALTEVLVRRHAAGDADLVGASGHSYLRLVGLTTLAWVWLDMAALAQRRLDEGSVDLLYVDKLTTARFYFAHLLPEAEHHLQVAAVESDVVMAVPDEGFRTP
ncbi:acyl-CoA dehydrogenase family protein [soil metagenome]